MKKLFFLTALAVSAAGLQAEEHGFQASLTPDIAVHPKTDEINGLALSIWGENPQRGVALGIVNGSTGKSEVSPGASLIMRMPTPASRGVWSITARPVSPAGKAASFFVRASSTSRQARSPAFRKAWSTARRNFTAASSRWSTTRKNFTACRSASSTSR